MSNGRKYVPGGDVCGACKRVKVRTHNPWAALSGNRGDEYCGMACPGYSKRPARKAPK